jgi:hypothetical protein
LCIQQHGSQHESHVPHPPQSEPEHESHAPHPPQSELMRSLAMVLAVVLPEAKLLVPPVPNLAYDAEGRPALACAAAARTSAKAKQAWREIFMDSVPPKGKC